MDKTLYIDDEFKNLISPLSPREYFQLEENILTDGCINPIITWNDVIVDGHNRYEICKKHNIPFKTMAMFFESRDEVIAWICKNQLGRRNISDETRKYLIGRQYESEKKLVSNPTGFNQYFEDDSDVKKFKKHRTAVKIAKENHIASTTVQKYSQYAHAIDKIQNRAPKIAEHILNGQYKVSHNNIVQISNLPNEDLEKLNNYIEKNQNKFVEYSKGRQLIDDITIASTKESIKNMPKFDPDASVTELYLTIPSWISSINRTQKNSDLSIISDNARSTVIQELKILIQEANKLLLQLEAQYE